VEAATPEERGPVADSLPAETIRAAAEPPIPQAVAAVFPAQPPQESPQPVESKGEGDLLSLIRARLARAISYPESARRRGLSGDLVLGLLLSPEGRIAEISLLASSGNPFLDRAVLKTLRDDGPYPYRPGLIRVPISFRLKTPS
jgi:TonB family protein